MFGEYVVIAFTVWRISTAFIREDAPAGPTPDQQMLTEIRDALRARRA